MSKIQWTDETWNPTVGCSRVSPGCENCYAERVAHRAMQPAHAGLTRATSRGPVWTGEVRCLPERLDQPLHWRKPRRVFVDSMSDLFHEAVPDDFIAEVFGVMAVCGGRELSWTAQSQAGRGGAFHGSGDGHQPCGSWTDFSGKRHQMRLPKYGHGPHTFQVLTKRPERMARLLSGGFRGRVAAAAYRWAKDRTDAGGLADAVERGDAWPLANVHLGTSVEDQPRADERIPHLLATPAAVRFLSLEPLLGPVDLQPNIGPHCRHAIPPDAPCDRYPGCTPSRIGWVIVGGESGPGARPCDVAWIRDLVRQGRKAGVPVFVKQLGSRPYDSEYRIGSYAPEDKRTPTTSDGAGGTTALGNLVLLRARKGDDPSEWPEDLRVQEWPGV